jgi:hypothetical protein
LSKSQSRPQPLRDESYRLIHTALAAIDCALQALGDAKLKLIAAELIFQVKKSMTIDWTIAKVPSPIAGLW